jgi:plasmid stability protein
MTAFCYHCGHMATLTIRNLRDATRQALRERAARNGRSMEAEARVILDGAVAAKGGGMALPPEQSAGEGPGLSKYEKQHLNPTQQAALLRLRKVFAPGPGERVGQLVDEFLAERRAEAERE